MRIVRISASAAALVCLSLAPAYAQKGKGGGAPTTHGNPHTSTVTAPATTARAHGNPHTTAAAPASTTSTSSASTGTTGGTRTTAAAAPLNPIAQRLQGKPLGSRIEKMLPPNMTLNTASAGFRNQGQFIAAVHVSRNLGIPFADLRAAMLGLPKPGAPTSTTPPSPMSLGQAIHTLKPSANSTTEASRAQTQATADLSITSSTTTAAKKR